MFASSFAPHISFILPSSSLILLFSHPPSSQPIPDHTGLTIPSSSQKGGRRGALTFERPRWGRFPSSPPAPTENSIRRSRKNCPNNEFALTRNRSRAHAVPRRAFPVP
eukprot:6549682-Pyramimonas_sp.AAC.1